MKKSFTIVELLLYMGIFSILVTVLGGILVNLIDLQLNTESNSEVSRNASFITSRFAYDFYNASSVSLPGAAGQSGSALTLVINSQNYSYTLSGSNLVLTNPSGSYNLNSPEVSITGFTVTRLGTIGKPNIKLDLTIQSNITPLGKPVQTASFSESFTLRHIP